MKNEIRHYSPNYPKLKRKSIISEFFLLFYFKGAVLFSRYI